MPIRSAGSRSGVNCSRENFTFRQLRQRLDRERLGQPGHAFEQHVAIGQQPDQQALDQVGLAHDHLAHFGKQRPHKSPGLLHRLVDRANSCIH